MSKDLGDPARLAEQDYKQLSDKDFVGLVFTEEDRLPMAYAREVIARGERLTPLLAEVIRDQSLWAEDAEHEWAVYHATFLLGAIGGRPAVPVLIEAVIRAHELGMDWIAEPSKSIFGSLGPDALPRLKEKAKDRSLSCYARNDLLGGMAALTLRHPELEAEVFPFIAEIVADETEADDAREWAADVLIDLGRTEYRDLVIRIAAKGVAGELFNEESVERHFKKGKDLYWYQVDWLKFYSDEEIADRQARWKREARAREKWAAQESKEYAISGTIVRKEPKVGRNDPCSCGSGKKYKKCCLGKDA